MKHPWCNSILSCITVTISITILLLISSVLISVTIISAALEAILSIFREKRTVPDGEIWVGLKTYGRKKTFFPGEEVMPASFREVCKFKQHANYDSGTMLLSGIGVQIAFSAEIIDPTYSTDLAKSTDKLIDRVIHIYKEDMARIMMNPQLDNISTPQKKHILEEVSASLLLDRAIMLGIKLSNINCSVTLRK